MISLRNRLNNAYSKKSQYTENVDFIKIKSGKNASVIYMLNYQCMKKLIIDSDNCCNKLLIL